MQVGAAVGWADDGKHNTPGSCRQPPRASTGLLHLQANHGRRIDLLKRAPGKSVYEWRASDANSSALGNFSIVLANTPPVSCVSVALRQGVGPTR